MLPASRAAFLSSWPPLCLQSQQLFPSSQCLLEGCYDCVRAHLDYLGYSPRLRIPDLSCLEVLFLPHKATFTGSRDCVIYIFAGGDITELTTLPMSGYLGARILVWHICYSYWNCWFIYLKSILYIRSHCPKNSCTLKIPLFFPPSPKPPGGYWSFYCCFAFSRMPHGWDYIICGLFRLASFTLAICI